MFNSCLEKDIPSVVTVHKILANHGYVKPQKRMKRIKPLFPIFDPKHCNEVWSADYKGKLSIIDFKTSTRERIDAWNENYYIQGSAYAEMFGERTDIIVEQVVILVVTEDGTVQEFVKQKHDYLDSNNSHLNIYF